MRLNFGGQKRSGAFHMVWPSACKGFCQFDPWPLSHARPQHWFLTNLGGDQIFFFFGCGAPKNWLGDDMGFRDFVSPRKIARQSQWTPATFCTEFRQVSATGPSGGVMGLRQARFPAFLDQQTGISRRSQISRIAGQEVDSKLPLHGGQSTQS